jgi:hypothetical protein
MINVDHKRLRADLLNDKPLDSYDFLAVDVKQLCDTSLMVFFGLCKGLRLWDKALEAGIRLDSLEQPRRGNIVDESGGYFAQRAARIESVRNK